MSKFETVLQIAKIILGIVGLTILSLIMLKL